LEAINSQPKSHRYGFKLGSIPGCGIPHWMVRVRITEKIMSAYLSQPQDIDLEPFTDSPDLPEGHLIVGGVKFFQLFPDMSEIVIHVPGNWNVNDDPIYYHQTAQGGHIILYNDITEQAIFVGHPAQPDTTQ
jgi:hypothetical protein